MRTNTDPKSSGRLGYACPTPHLVQTSKEEPLLEDCTNPTAAPGPLTAAALSALRATFEEKRHYPSEAMWRSLAAILSTLEHIANGTAEPLIHLAALDPGVGKTQAVVHFLRALLASEDHRHVSVIVCVGRRSQIEDFVREAELPHDEFAVFTSDGDNLGKDLVKLGRGEADKQNARILFTTHSMVESRCRGLSFAEASEFHYRGQPRTVRIWDEAILPGREVTLSRDDIFSILKPLRVSHPQLADALETLNARIRETEDGSQIVIPDLAADFGVDLNEGLRLVEDEPADRKDTVTGLWFLFGNVVTVRRDGAYNTILDYRETLSADIAPLLVLDASARVRTTYALWEQHRGGVLRLPEAPKDYSPLKLKVWSTGGGKSAFQTNGDTLLEGIAKVVNERVSEDWLLIHHKNPAFQRKLERLLVPRTGKVYYLNWGRHDATNEFASVPNVILAGTLFYPKARYEALGRAAAGVPSAHGPFPIKSSAEVELGEHRNLILQALCRGAVRKCHGASCPAVTAYIIASARSGIRDELPFVFPNATVEAWRPVKHDLKGNPARAATFVIEALTTGATEVPFAAVRKHLGITNTSNFNKTIRRHATFVEALAEQGIIEGPLGHPSSFMRAAVAYFGQELENARNTDDLPAARLQAA